MRFVNPMFLVLTAIVPLAGLWWAFLRARREKALTRITLNVPKSKTAGLQMTLIVAGLALSLVAAARPQKLVFVSEAAASTENTAVLIDAQAAPGQPHAALPADAAKRPRILRFAPSETSPVVATLPPGTAVETLHVRGAWRRVSAPGATGWTRGCVGAVR